MGRTSPVGVAATARAMAHRAESFSTLPRIDCPALVLVGAQDAATPPDSMRAMHAAISGARWAEITGAGHVPPLEQPGKFAEALRSFLVSLPD